jgi:hypothetical protein
LRNWLSVRGSFNHQWLANNYLNQLGYWVSAMNAEGDDPTFVEDFVNDTLNQWNHRSIEAQWVVDNMVDALSPIRLFDAEPLSRIPQEIREPVAKACHLLWLQRTEVPRERAINAKNQVDLKYARLVACLSKRSRPLTQKSAKKCFPLAVEFEAACEELKKAFEELPKIEYW